MVPTYALYYLIGCRMMTCSAVEKFENDSQVHAILTNLGEGSVAIMLGSLPFMIVGVPLGYGIGALIERFLERRAVHQRSRRAALAQRRRSEEHTSELQSLMRSSYAVFCLKKKKKTNNKTKKEM